MTLNELTNNQINMVKELTGIDHNADLAFRKFQEVCLKYKADPKEAIDDLTKGWREFSKSKTEPNG